MGKYPSSTLKLFLYNLKDCECKKTIIKWWPYENSEVRTTMVFSLLLFQRVFYIWLFIYPTICLNFPANEWQNIVLEVLPTKPHYHRANCYIIALISSNLLICYSHRVKETMDSWSKIFYSCYKEYRIYISWLMGDFCTEFITS